VTDFLQLHFLTFYPPSNLNRDDLGRPKSAVIGGSTRLRISSQALKRTWRTSDVFKTTLDGHLASRTQRIGEVIHEHLLAAQVAPEKAVKITREIIAVFGKPKPEADKAPLFTEQLAFISPEERAAALELADRMVADAKFDAKKQAGEILRRSDTAADLAMFGRMLADNPDYNREAAVQVAHAVTTHKTTIEDDYYTAVDDLKKSSEDAGAGFLGEAGFGAGVFYLYACIDRDLLRQNLGGDDALAGLACAALVEAAAKVSPAGKQASFASRARAEYILAERGTAQPRALTAAFLKPVSEAEEGGMMVASIDKLTKLRAAFGQAYGDGDGPGAGPTAEMNIHTGQGTLEEIKAFCRAGV
jgi:CRISPR system Cascade subunit CasC